ncbi:uncharacterized protein B0I36DRAFT_357114 [Microdochium trichocladiopsis]|uniref:Uncharacterized protein n=1 Tax=Microdochium trichocladiopsis TaxID=1682393 RepID=A0A9P9BVG6_9PEZI|nr:uncharacterized protein B0I36DRAFT_357114 [Microdochium trichocladiopsis]KAH7039717.1 hypothetical protein B0I36DRAFT_357114 [Microdochium trichocladiopsis]
MRSLTFFALLAPAVGLVAASPLELRAGLLEPRADPFCGAVQKAVTLLKQQAAATKYCVSYLSITTPAAVVVPTTVTVTTTPITALPTDNPCFVNAKAPAPQVAAKPRRALIHASDDAKSPHEKHSASQHEERAVAKPAPFAAFNAAAVISSACKCLSILTPATPTIYDTTYATPTVYSDKFAIYDGAGRYLQYSLGSETPFYFAGSDLGAATTWQLYAPMRCWVTHWDPDPNFQKPVLISGDPSVVKFSGPIDSDGLSGQGTLHADGTAKLAFSGYSSGIARFTLSTSNNIWTVTQNSDANQQYLDLYARAVAV